MSFIDSFPTAPPWATLAPPEVGVGFGASTLKLSAAWWAAVQLSILLAGSFLTLSTTCDELRSKCTGIGWSSDQLYGKGL